MLTATDIHLRRGDNTVLKGVDFHLSMGEMIGLIGPNGAGKTSLLRCLVGLERPERGEIRLGDKSLAHWPARALASEIAYLAQSAACHWPMAVERIVALGRLPHLGSWQSPAATDVAAVKQAMAATDVAHLRHRQATALSGGEQARVQLARSLAVGARGLFADEPVAGLDPGHQIQVMELLRGHARSGHAVVIVLHDLTLAARYCSRLVLMAEGKVAAEGSPAEVMTPGNLAAVYGIAARIETHDTGLLVVPAGLAHSR
ncbi:ABC transporter ATP-binding protein [Magnetospirillum aberrantis]|uniref:ABC transporter ATP-binding protein n=1 Tax=Magnetospirillum aberrantis SpK TaxID=908842 RepID=A0A7C9UX56_9PROT|nr:ABC transporter ATP-binding protein [Magnetospirillum aberrantis]NFV78813.1 ABC transporter ATP-binding protein [Magnetospirillum aberrantis SpK]